jgi:hypothetical protein
MFIGFPAGLVMGIADANLAPMSDDHRPSFRVLPDKRFNLDFTSKYPSVRA